MLMIARRDVWRALDWFWKLEREFPGDYSLMQRLQLRTPGFLLMTLESWWTGE